MRVLTLNANLKGVGTYRRCFHFSRELARAGNDVTMVTVSRSSRYRPRTYHKRDWVGEHDRPEGEGPWVRVIEGPNLGYKWLPGWGSAPLDILLRTRELSVGNYDVVYGFEYQPNVSWPVYLTRPFCAFTYYSDWCDWYAGQSNSLRGIKLAHRVDAFLEERIRFLASKVSVISPTLRERAVAMGIPPERVEWVKEGADTDYIQDLPQDDNRRRLNIPVGKPVALSMNEHDIRHLLQILSIAMQENPDLLAVIVGNLGDDTRQAARRLGIYDRIMWPGWVSDLDYPRYLSCADFFLLPVADVLLNYARFSGKLLDFLSAGRPVVTNNVGDIGALVAGKQVGRAVKDDDEFVAAIGEFAADRSRCSQTGARARRLMVSEWRWQLRGAQIAGIVQS